MIVSRYSRWKLPSINEQNRCHVINFLHAQELGAFSASFCSILDEDRFYRPFHFFWLSLFRANAREKCYTVEQINCVKG